MTSPLRDLFHVRGPHLRLGPAVGSLVLLGVVVLASAAVACDGEVPEWERRVLVFFNDWPGWLEPIMWVLQQPGVLFFPYVVGVIVVASTKRVRYGIPFLLLPIFKLTVEKGLVKPLVDRSRPYTSVGPEIEARGSSLLDEPSFPSGHTTTAVATALLIAALLPSKWRPLPIIWGFSVGWIRMYYGEHNLLDVVAGAALASMFAIMCYLLLFNRWVGDGPASTDSEKVEQDPAGVRRAKIRSDG